KPGVRRRRHRRPAVASLRKRLLNPFPPGRGSSRRRNPPIRYFQRSAPALTRQETERSQRLHVEPAIGRNTQARLKCAHRKCQIRSKDAVAFTFVKPAPPQQRLRAEKNALLHFRRRHFVRRVPGSTRRRFCCPRLRATRQTV